MNDREIKEVRKQLRKIVEDLLPQILNDAFVKSIDKTVNANLDTRLAEITKHVAATLDKLDKRSQEINSYVVRNTVPHAPTKG
jgi:hypothetical protein